MCVSHRVWVILTQAPVRVLCCYPFRLRSWANRWYLRRDPLVISPLGGVFPVVLVVTSMGFTIFYIIAAIAPASAKLQPRAVRHGFLNVRSDYPTGVATHTLAVGSTGPTHKEEYLLEKAMHTPPQTTNIYCNASSTQYDSISCSYCNGYAIAADSCSYCNGYAIAADSCAYCNGYAIATTIPCAYCNGYAMVAVPCADCDGYAIAAISCAYSRGHVSKAAAHYSGYASCATYNYSRRLMAPRPATLAAYPRHCEALRLDTVAACPRHCEALRLDTVATYPRHCEAPRSATVAAYYRHRESATAVYEGYYPALRASAEAANRGCHSAPRRGTAAAYDGCYLTPKARAAASDRGCYPVPKENIAAGYEGCYLVLKESAAAADRGRYSAPRGGATGAYPLHSLARYAAIYSSASTLAAALRGTVCGFAHDLCDVSLSASQPPSLVYSSCNADSYIAAAHPCISAAKSRLSGALPATKATQSCHSYGSLNVTTKDTDLAIGNSAPLTQPVLRAVLPEEHSQCTSIDPLSCSSVIISMMALACFAPPTYCQWLQGPSALLARKPQPRGGCNTSLHYSYHHADIVIVARGLLGIAVSVCGTTACAPVIATCADPAYSRGLNAIPPYSYANAVSGPTSLLPSERFLVAPSPSHQRLTAGRPSGCTFWRVLDGAGAPFSVIMASPRLPDVRPQGSVLACSGPIDSGPLRLVVASPRLPDVRPEGGVLGCSVPIGSDSLRPAEAGFAACPLMGSWTHCCSVFACGFSMLTSATPQPRGGSCHPIISATPRAMRRRPAIPPVTGPEQQFTVLAYRTARPLQSMVSETNAQHLIQSSKQLLEQSNLSTQQLFLSSQFWLAGAAHSTHVCKLTAAFDLAARVTNAAPAAHICTVAAVSLGHTATSHLTSDEYFVAATSATLATSAGSDAYSHAIYIVATVVPYQGLMTTQAMYQSGVEAALQVLTLCASCQPGPLMALVALQATLVITCTPYQTSLAGAAAAMVGGRAACSAGTSPCTVSAVGAMAAVADGRAAYTTGTSQRAEGATAAVAMGTMAAIADGCAVCAPGAPLRTMGAMAAVADGCAPCAAGAPLRAMGATAAVADGRTACTNGASQRTLGAMTAVAVGLDACATGISPHPVGLIAVVAEGLAACAAQCATCAVAAAVLGFAVHAVGARLHRPRLALLTQFAMLRSLHNCSFSFTFLLLVLAVLHYLEWNLPSTCGPWPAHAYRSLSVSASVFFSRGKSVRRLSSIPIFMLAVSMLPCCRAVVSTRGVSRGTTDSANTAGLITRHLAQVQRLASLLPLADAAAISSAVYSCTDRNVARQATGAFNQALTPGSTSKIAMTILSQAVSRVLWVGCGPGFETIILALLADRPIEIIAIDHLACCIESSVLLLRKVYMAVHGCEMDDAVALDPTAALIRIGQASIRFICMNAWALDPAFGSPIGPIDFIYSTAEQESDQGQPLALFLQALDGGCGALLALYITMWSKTGGHRASPRLEPIRIYLESGGGSKTLLVCDLCGFVMFPQPPTCASRASLHPHGWGPAIPSSPALRSVGRRVAVFFVDDNLWYASTVAAVMSSSVLLRLDDASWPDTEVDDSMGVSILILQMPPTPETLSLVAHETTLRGGDGLYLSHSESGYQGVSRSTRAGDEPVLWGARIWRFGKWDCLGRDFVTAKGAAVVYTEYRSKKVPCQIAIPLSHVYKRSLSMGGPKHKRSWVAHLYLHGQYQHIGTFSSHGAATSAYWAAVATVVAQPTPAPVRPTVPASHRGVRLHLAYNQTGYAPLSDVAADSGRACSPVQRGRKGSTSWAPFDTAVEAAYCFAVALHSRHS